MELVDRIYRLTRDFPPSEQWALSAQLRRASISVPSNIAEGYGRQATGEYRHHLSIARASLLEVETQLIICQRLGYAPKQAVAALLTEIGQISRMTAALISKLR
jgi:four helix bundle protein